MYKLERRSGLVVTKADSATKVFVIYTHDSPEHERRVRQLCDRLRSNGVDAWIDQYVEDDAPE
jgi:hypothetical protein